MHKPVKLKLSCVDNLMHSLSVLDEGYCYDTWCGFKSKQQLKELTKFSRKIYFGLQSFWSQTVRCWISVSEICLFWFFPRFLPLRGLDTKNIESIWDKSLFFFVKKNNKELTKHQKVKKKFKKFLFNKMLNRAWKIDY